MRAGQWPGQVIHRPARLEDLRLLFMHVVQQEDALAQARDHAVVGRPVQPGRGGAFQAVQQTLLILVGLQLANEPATCVGEGLVIHIHGVLGHQHLAHAKGARLLEHAQHQGLGRRVGDRRQVAKDLVEVEDGAQHRGARLRAHPGFDGGIEQCNEEHALGIGEVRQVKDAVTRPPVWPIQQAGDIQRLAFDPGLEGRGGQDVVKQHGQLETILLWEKGVDVKNAQLGKGRGLGLHDQLAQVQVFAFAPGVLEDVGEQDVLARAHGVYILHAHQPQQRGDGAGDLLAQQLAVALPGDGRGFERGQDADGDAGIGAGGVDGKVGSVLEGQDAVRADIPACQAVFPALGGFGGGLLDGLAFAARLVGIDPGLEVLRQQVGEVQQQVGEIALGVNQQSGHAVQGGLFQHTDAQAGLA